MTETDVNPRLGTIEITCPHCGKVNTAASEVVGAEEVLDPVAAPSNEAISLCSGCYGMSIMHNGVAVKLTTDELEKSREDPSFRRIEALSNLIRHVRKDHSDGEPEEDNETTHRLMGLSVVINTSTGEIEFPDDSADLPEGLKKAIAESVRDLHFRRMREEVQQFVTPEVANHILSVYGDDRASMPSVSKTALISLIRLADEMDEEMLDCLNGVEEFHGYVLAVSVIMKDDEKDGNSGRRILEHIAGLEETE